MSSRYSANQYEDAFKQQKMQNWCVGNNIQRAKLPTARKDRTTFIVDDKMHLLPGLAKEVEDSQQDRHASSTQTPAVLAVEASKYCPLKEERPASSGLANEKQRQAQVSKNGDTPQLKQ